MLGIAPEGVPWIKGDRYACIQKWQSPGAFSAQGKFVDKFCLANLNHALEVANTHLKFAPDFTSCTSTKSSHKLKLCALKVDKQGGRLSYTSKSHVPWSCFSESKPHETQDQTYRVLEVAVEEGECEGMLTLSPDEQRSLKVTSTTTIATSTSSTSITTTESSTTQSSTSTSTPTTSTTEVILEKDNEVLYEITEPLTCSCGDGLIGEIKNKVCICSPAPCGIPGSIFDGLSCECLVGLSGEITWSGPEPSGECIAEAKDLFVEGEEKYWQYEGRSIKCCVSSQGKPTEIQNIDADDLPSKGALGRSSRLGCGYMFGATYHNIGHKGADPTCKVPIADLMRASGATLDAVKTLLNLG